MEYIKLIGLATVPEPKGDITIDVPSFLEIYRGYIAYQFLKDEIENIKSSLGKEIKVQNDFIYTLKDALVERCIRDLKIKNYDLEDVTNLNEFNSGISKSDQAFLNSLGIEEDFMISVITDIWHTNHPSDENEESDFEDEEVVLDPETLSDKQ